MKPQELSISIEFAGRRKIIGVLVDERHFNEIPGFTKYFEESHKEIIDTFAYLMLAKFADDITQDMINELS